MALAPYHAFPRAPALLSSRIPSSRQVVTRSEMTIDKENGWSKGFGFVSFGSTSRSFECEPHSMLCPHG